MSVWDEKNVKLLREYWSKGHTASEIAKMLGGNVTRNSVIGKAHRMVLPARATSKRSKILKKEASSSNQAETEKYIGRKSKFRALLIDPTYEPENPKQLEELGDGHQHCRYPIGHPDDQNFYFCGRSPVEGFSYCRLHILVSYQSKDQKEELIDKEDDIPAFLEKKVKAAK